MRLKRPPPVNIALTLEECNRVVNFIALLAKIDKRVKASSSAKASADRENKKKKKLKSCPQHCNKTRCLCGSCFYLLLIYPKLKNHYNQPRATA